MFDIGWSELLVIAIVAIIVIGPKDLPRLMRTFGQYAGKIRRAASEFTRQFEDAMHEAELDEVRQAMADVRDTAASLDLSTAIDQPVMRAKPAAVTAPARKPAPKGKKVKTASPKAKTATTRATKTQASKTQASKTRVAKTPASKDKTP
jgi:sec-independent protein translocase protein TatB